MNCFDSIKLDFPILLNRNSVLLVRKKQIEKLHKINTTVEDLFLSQDRLLSEKDKSFADQKFDFKTQINFLEQQFTTLRDLSKLTDISFVGAVNAQEKKQVKGLKNLEKRLLKAQKNTLSDQVQRLSMLHSQLFPDDQLQERTLNFVSFYLEIGEQMIPSLIENLDPLNPDFTLIEY